jgi:hypothetical protein
MEHTQQAATTAVPPAGQPLWDEEASLLGPRLYAIVAAVLAVTVVVSAQILPHSGVPEKPSTVQDDFDRTSAESLGTAPTGQAWIYPTEGTWGTGDGAAYVVRANAHPGGRTMALVDLKSDNGSVSAAIGQLGAGWGLVFRDRGPTEFWTLTASPTFASYNLQHVADGKSVAAGNVAMAKQATGTVVTVQFQGPTITILIDGKAVKTLTDPDGGNGGTRVGLVLADGSTTDARWKGFEARQLPLSAAAAAPGRPTTSSTRRAGG